MEEDGFAAGKVLPVLTDKILTPPGVDVGGEYFRPPRVLAAGGSGVAEVGTSLASSGALSFVRTRLRCYDAACHGRPTFSRYQWRLR